MKPKTKLTIIFIVFVLLIGFSFLIQKPKTEQDFFEENKIIDDAPIGKINNEWIYQTSDNKIIKTKEVIPTKRGLEYQNLVLGDEYYG